MIVSREYFGRETSGNIRKGTNKHLKGDPEISHYSFHACNSLNGLAIFGDISNLSNGWIIFEGELYMKTLFTTLLQMVCRLMLHSKFIFKGMLNPDDNCQVDLQA